MLEEGTFCLGRILSCKRNFWGKCEDLQPHDKVYTTKHVVGVAVRQSSSLTFDVVTRKWRFETE